MNRLVLTFTVVTVAALAQTPAPAPTPATGSRDLTVTVGKSVLVDSPVIIERVAVANASLAEAVAITPREVLVNGKAVGETSMIVWQQGGNRLFFDLTVRRNETHINAVRREMAQEMGNENVSLDLEGDAVFLRGNVADITSADRAVAIASTLGRPVNLLRVNIPGTDAQILLKVKFADVDRSASQQLGINFAYLNGKMPVSTSIGPGAVTVTGGQNGTPTTFTLSQALNIFLFRPDLDLVSTIAALQSRNLLQILAEPNVLAINGHSASFLAGGEFPYPTLQGGASVGSVTIAFREFGVRINFTPTVTPRGTIRLSVTPEVSSLDFANGLVFQGFTVPAISTRRVQTEVELESGQSFAIGGLLDNRETETFNKIPGIGDIPFFGKLFRSRSINKNNSELLIMVTPEVVRPIDQGKPLPELNYPSKFMTPNTSSAAPRTPGMDVTGPVPPKKPVGTMPVEQLIKSQQSTGQQQAPAIQYVPVPMMPAQQPQAPPTPAPVKPGSNAAGQQ